jgi:hypothetical protein
LEASVLDLKVEETKVSIELADLEKKIERKISDLEREKGRLKDDLKVVRQATAIAGDFNAAYGGSSSEWNSENTYDEPRAEAG